MVSAPTRDVVVHVDDLGMSPPANRGGVEAIDGTATCGSVMVPCPAFREMAGIARDRPELDLGVHLTLNAEYASYRWGPVIGDGAPSLRTADGGMWQTVQETVEHADPDEVERELRAQVETALEAGIDVTHLDSHMGTVFDLKFVESYFRLAREFDLPAFVPRLDRDRLPDELAAHLSAYLTMIDEHEAAGYVVFDHFDSDSLQFTPGTGLAHNTARIDGLGDGLSYLITHCATGGEELSSITHDWRQREEERRIYTDGSMASVLEAAGCRAIGMRELRDAQREGRDRGDGG